MTTLTYRGVKPDAVAGLTNELRSEGATITGDATPANPMVGSDHGVTLSAVYYADTELLSVNIVKKPFIIGAGFVSDQILQHLAKYGYVPPTD